MGRGLIIALFASLAFNVFAVGFFSGRVLSPASPMPKMEARMPEMRGPGNPFRMMAGADALPPETRAAFRELIRTKLPEVRGHYQEIRRVRRELSVLLMAQDWDREAVAAKMNELQEEHARQREALDQAFIAAFESLSAEDRRILIEASAKRRDGRRKRRREGFHLYDDRKPNRPASKEDGE